MLIQALPWLLVLAGVGTAAGAAPARAARGLGGGTPYPFADLNTAEVRALERGEVITTDLEAKNSGGHAQGMARGYVTIDRGWREVWKVLQDYDRQWEYLPHAKLTKATRYEAGGRRAWVFHQFRVFFFDIKYTLIEDSNEADHVVHFHLDQDLPHDLRDVEGSWRLMPVDQGLRTVIEFTTYVDSGHFVPRFIERWLSRRDLPTVLKNLRHRVESGGTWKKGRVSREQ